MKLSRTLSRLALYIGLFAAIAMPASAQTWNLSADFSADTNPNGAWSYGWKGGALNAPLVLFTNTAAVPAWYSTQQLAGWSASFPFPYVAYNISAQDWGYQAPNPGEGSFSLHPHEVLLHPFSVNGEKFSVIRWTAPIVGLYTLSSAFRRFQDTAGYNSYYGVLLNGVELSGAGGLLSDFNTVNSSATYNNPSLALNTGDTLDFVVGSGNDGTSNNDGTTVSANINIITRTATVSGRITLQSAFDQAQPITFEFRPTDGSEVFTRVVTLNPDRTYTLTFVPVGNYNVWIKGERWLSKVLTVDATNGNVSGVNAALKAGDANNDNFCDVFDLDMVIRAFDTAEGDPDFMAVADLNVDGFVDVFDLDLLIRNFDGVGDA